MHNHQQRQHYYGTHNAYYRPGHNTTNVNRGANTDNGFIAEPVRTSSPKFYRSNAAHLTNNVQTDNVYQGQPQGLHHVHREERRNQVEGKDPAGIKYQQLSEIRYSQRLAEQLYNIII